METLTSVSHFAMFKMCTFASRMSLIASSWEAQSFMNQVFYEFWECLQMMRLEECRSYLPFQ